MATFDNKVVFITGGTSGIGRDTAIKFASEGAKVAFTGRRAKEGKETEAAIKSAGGQGLFIESDVSVRDDAVRAVKAAVDGLGAIDIAFNNAGIEETPLAFEEQNYEFVEKLFAINVLGMWTCLQEEIKAMLAAGKGGCIINNSSIAGLKGMAQVSAYCASKHAVVGFTKSLANEFAGRKIRVNAVAPGPIQTEMFDRFAGPNPEVMDYILKSVPMGRVGSTDEIAHCVLFLASEKSSYVTGQVLTIDGGMI